MSYFAISLLILGTVAFATAAQPDKSDKPTPKRPFTALPEDKAWGHLPPRKTPPLPEWARVMAGPLPKTTAKLLELDYLHRVKNPLGPVVSARIRWAVADALDSPYGRDEAEADLKQAGGVRKGCAEGEEIALAFAKKLTLAGYKITDEEFADLLKRYSPEQVTAIVHTVAYANFHNRIILGLGVKGESPVAPPVALAFDLDAAKTKAPERPSWDDLKSAKGDALSVRLDWSEKKFDQLNATLETQKERKLRMPLPDKTVFDKFPPREKEQGQKILWNTVSTGYQPEMTRAWFAPLYSFYEEAQVDRQFTNSVFWVVTRTNDCFY